MKEKKRRKLQKEWVGGLAAILGMFAFVPLLYNTTVYKSTHSLHYAWLILRIGVSALWIWYGVANDLVPNIVSATAAIAILLYLLTVKYYWESTGQAMHQK
jgi:uncharacterized protein with PQ loop repeat